MKFDKIFAFTSRIGVFAVLLVLFLFLGFSALPEQVQDRWLIRFGLISEASNGTYCARTYTRVYWERMADFDYQNLPCVGMLIRTEEGIEFIPGVHIRGSLFHSL